MNRLGERSLLGRLRARWRGEPRPDDGSRERACHSAFGCDEQGGRRGGAPRSGFRSVGKLDGKRKGARDFDARRRERATGRRVARGKRRPEEEMVT